MHNFKHTYGKFHIKNIGTFIPKRIVHIFENLIDGGLE